jgi:hypothetical protein
MSGGTEGWGDTEPAALGRVAANFAELDRQAGDCWQGSLAPSTSRSS